MRQSDIFPNPSVAADAPPHSYEVFEGRPRAISSERNAGDANNSYLKPQILDEEHCRNVEGLEYTFQGQLDRPGWESVFLRV